MADEKVLYSTTAVNTGGRASGESRLQDGSYTVKIAPPKEMGGSGRGQNPEQLFALGYSACYNSALGAAMKEADVKGKSEITAEVDLLQDPADDGFKLRVVLTVAIEGQDLTKTQELAERAHQICPYSKATQGNIDVELKAAEFQA